MTRSTCGALLLLAALAAASPARALGFTLALDPAQSLFTPEGGGPAEMLSGTLRLEVDALPLLANTGMALTDVAVASSGGLAIGLDPTLASPGLGVLFADGSFLIPTLFLRIVNGAQTFDLAVTDVTGSLDLAGTEVTGLQSSFALDTDLEMSGSAGVEIQAVPEPGTGLALAFALAALAARCSRREGVR